jgi:putative alpha-1,2-mannosidase
MKVKKTCKSKLFLILVTGIMISLGGCTKKGIEPVDYVAPYIGTIGHLLKTTSPSVYLPHGQLTILPRVTPGITDRYFADSIFNFPCGSGILMPTTGYITFDEDLNASKFDHDQEVSTPYYYSVLLEDTDIKVEYTLTDHAVYYRFTFPEAGSSNIILSMMGNAKLKIIGKDVVEGTQLPPIIEERSGRAGRSGFGHFYAQFSKPFIKFGTWDGNTTISEAAILSGTSPGMFISFSTDRGEAIEMKVGISRESVDEAKGYLEQEIPNWSFNEVKNQARDIWNKELSKIKIAGGTEEQRTIFYTALYRTMGRKANVWDTYRSAYPLQTIIEPKENMKVINNFIREFDETGWLTSSGGMIGNHAAPVILDAYMKNLRDFDVEKAYAGMKKNAMEATMVPWRDRGPLTELDLVYLEKGFFPALNLGQEEWVPEVHRAEYRQAVAVTLEHCFDDWCLAQMAKELGKKEDYEYFMKRAHNYQNLFDARNGYMAPKNAKGEWVFEKVPLDPIWSGGQGGRDYYAEMNAMSYTFSVQHDVAGLMNLIGGREKFAARLDKLFRAQFERVTGGNGNKWIFLRQFPDMTGLTGQYAQGNEPSLHIPYLYNYAGEPWKTQRRLRQLMEIWYTDTPLGICGDEDGGAMSSWFVFTSMGFYPVCPGRNVYDIGSPIFEKSAIDLGENKTFVVEAKNVSQENKYIQSAKLNGEALNKPWFTHEDLMKGGNLVLEMGPRPNKVWGSSPEAAPPSMSAEIR